jgi:hypothetical protein
VSHKAGEPGQSAASASASGCVAMFILGHVRSARPLCRRGPREERREGRMLPRGSWAPGPHAQGGAGTGRRLPREHAPWRSTQPRTGSPRGARAPPPVGGHSPPWEAAGPRQQRVKAKISCKITGWTRRFSGDSAPSSRPPAEPRDDPDVRSVAKPVFGAVRTHSTASSPSVHSPG